MPVVDKTGEKWNKDMPEQGLVMVFKTVNKCGERFRVKTGGPGEIEGNIFSSAYTAAGMIDRRRKRPGTFEAMGRSIEGQREDAPRAEEIFLSSMVEGMSTE